MNVVTIIAVVVLIGFGIFARGENKPEPSETPDVEGVTESTVSPTPEASASAASPQPTPKPSATPKTTSGSSEINVNVDSNIDSSNQETIVYPGSTKQSGDVYTTNTSGATVFDWYKAEMEKRSYQIRNQVKASANEKFKGVLQGVNGNTSFKVTIDQENAGAVTKITFGE